MVAECDCVDPDRWYCFAYIHGVPEEWEEDRGYMAIEGGPCDCECHRHDGNEPEPKKVS